MVGCAATVAVVGLSAVPVEVEAHVGNGLPGFSVIGSSGSAAGHAAHRVRTALAAAGVTLPQRKTLLSLAPADIPKTGARFDLAMAVAILVELELFPQAEVDGSVFLGELALDGSVRPVAGVLPAAASLAGSRRRLFVADGNAAEAALVDGIQVSRAASLTELIQILRRERPPRPGEAGAQRPAVGGERPGEAGAERPAVGGERPGEAGAERPAVGGERPGEAGAPLPADLAEVRGQPEARRALEIAAAGGHHLLLIGAPGCGKSMLAQRLPTILPPLSRSEALELAAVRSVAGLLRSGGGLDHRPPLRAPHHSVSVAALLGGGTGVARPGELSLAHRGVLFLDELFEWPRHLLEALREPLEEGVVRLARAQAAVVYPALMQLVGSANPCPCGGGERCGCTDEAIWRYRARLSGPLADRFDLAPSVARLSASALLAAEDSEPSAAVAARVCAARAMAVARWGAINREARPRMLRKVARRSALRIIAAAVDSGAVTGRGFDRALRVARTCADLEGSELIEPHHAYEALGHRLQLRACVGATAAGATPGGQAGRGTAPSARSAAAHPGGIKP